MMASAQIVVAVAIVAAIGLGYRLKINVGLIAILFAYLIGTLMVGMEPGDIIDSWPVSLFFVIFAVSIFYNFAVVNGTLDALAGRLLHRFHRHPDAIYIVLFLVATVLAGSGAGFFAMMAVLCPIGIKLAQKMGKNTLIAAQAVNWGACAGANIMTSGDGVVFQKLMIDAGFGDQAFRMGIPIFLFTFSYPLIALVALWLWDRSHDLRGPSRLRIWESRFLPGSAAVATLGGPADGARPSVRLRTLGVRARVVRERPVAQTNVGAQFVEELGSAGSGRDMPKVSRVAGSEPDSALLHGEAFQADQNKTASLKQNASGTGGDSGQVVPFTHKQRQTLVLMAATLILVLLFPLLNLAFPDVAWLASINSRVDISLVCVSMAVIALLLKLSDQKEVIQRIPWNTIIMICGMSMLIHVAIKAGVVDSLSQMMNSAVPQFFLPLAFCLVAGVMSFFSSTLSVVCPTLFPVVAALCAANPALNPTLLFTAVVAGSLSTNISPFSSAGSLMQMSFPQAERGRMFNAQIVKGMPVAFGLALVSIFVLSVGMALFG